MIRDSFIKVGRETKSPFITNPFRFAGVEWATALTNWLKRKPLTINGAAKTPDHNETFTYADQTAADAVWVPDSTNSDVDFSAGNLPVSGESANQGVYIDLQTVIGETIGTSWTLSFKHTQSAKLAGMYYFLQNSTTRNSSTAKDGIGLRQTDTTNYYDVEVCDGTGSASGQVDHRFTIAPDTTSEERWIKFVRDGNYVQIIFYADSELTEVLDASPRLDISSLTLATARYFVISTAGTGNSIIIDDFKFYNGVTTVENIPSQQTATVEDDFSGTDDWADQGSGVGVNTTTDRLEFSSWTDNTTNNSSTLDLGSALSDTDWTIRFKLQWTGFSNTTDWTAPAIGMFSADSATGGNSAQDMLFYWGIANGATKASYLSSADNSTVSGTDTNLNYAWVLDTTYYIELQRDGSNFSATIWTGSYNGTEVASGTDTIGGTVSGLRYFGAKSPVTNRGGSFTGWIDDVQVWDNFSGEINPTTLTDYSLPIKIIGDTNLQRKTAETFEDIDFPTANWNKAGATNGLTINDADDRIDFETGTATETVVHDLGSTQSDVWRLDFHVHNTTVTKSNTDNVELLVHLSDSDQTEDANTSQEHLGVRIVIDTAVDDVWLQGGTGTLNGGDVINNIVTTGYSDKSDYYFTLLSTSSTNARLIIYADSARNISLYDTGDIAMGTPINLRYIKIATDDDSASNVFNGYVDTIRFWDGITNPVNQEVATFSDDFTSYADTTAGDAAYPTDDTVQLRVNPANNNIDFATDLTGGANDTNTLYGDINNAILDDKFCIRFITNFTTATKGSNSNNLALFIGVTDDTTTDINTSQQHLGILYRLDSAEDDIEIASGESGANGGDSPFTINNATGLRYIEIIRDKLNATINVYSDLNYSILVESISTTLVEANANSLRYFKIGTWILGNTDHNLAGTVDDIEFWNGITSPNAEGRKIVFTDNAFDGDAVEYASETVSYDPINGDLEAVVKIPTLTTGADTTIQMYYDYAATNPSYVPEVIPTVSSILEQDFSADESWTHSSKTSISSGVLNWQNNATGTNLFHHAYRAIPQLKNDYFDVRFKLDIDVLSGSGNQDVASISWILCDANNTNSTSVGGTATGIGFRLGFGSASYVPVFEAFEVEGTGFNSDNAVDNIDFATTPTTGIIYIRLHRTSLTSVTIGIYSDPDFALTNLIEEETLTITSNINDLDIFQISTRNGSQETTRSVSGTIDDFTIVNNNREEATYDGNYKAVYNLHGNSLDSTVYGNDGTDTAVDWEQQNNSVGLFSNGDTTQINFGDQPEHDNIFAGGGTISFTFNANSDGELSAGRIYQKNGESFFRVERESGGLMGFDFVHYFSGSDGSWHGIVGIPINKINIVTIKYNSDSVVNNPIVIINGITWSVKNGMIDESSTPTGTASTGSDLEFATDPSNIATFDGLIDNVKMSNTSRPSSEAITSYNAEKSDSDIITAGDENTQ